MNVNKERYSVSSRIVLKCIRGYRAVVSLAQESLLDEDRGQTLSIVAQTVMSGQMVHAEADHGRQIRPCKTGNTLKIDFPPTGQK